MLNHICDAFFFIKLDYNCIAIARTRPGKRASERGLKKWSSAGRAEGCGERERGNKRRRVRDRECEREKERRGDGKTDEVSSRLIGRYVPTPSQISISLFFSSFCFFLHLPRSLSLSLSLSLLLSLTPSPISLSLFVVIANTESFRKSVLPINTME